MQLHEDLSRRTPLEPMLARSTWMGMMAIALSLAGILTLPVGLALTWRYRTRIAHLMMAARRESKRVQGLDLCATRAVEYLSNAHPMHPRRRGERCAGRPLCRALLALALGVLAAWLQLSASGIELSPNRMMVVSWTWAWPTVLALGLLWDGDTRRKLLIWGGPTSLCWGVSAFASRCW